MYSRLYTRMFNKYFWSRKICNKYIIKKKIHIKPFENNRLEPNYYIFNIRKWWNMCIDHDF